MIHPIPPGTRDVLPDEMRELRRLHHALIEVFEAKGYGEVATPAIEYDEVMARGDGGSGRSAYRFFDESGELLALRSEIGDIHQIDRGYEQIDDRLRALGAQIERVSAEVPA